MLFVPKARTLRGKVSRLLVSDATQDFTGLTGADAHYDNLMQQAYENDLASRGF